MIPTKVNRVNSMDLLYALIFSLEGEQIHVFFFNNPIVCTCCTMLSVRTRSWLLPRLSPWYLNCFRCPSFLHHSYLPVRPSKLAPFDICLSSLALQHSFHNFSPSFFTLNPLVSIQNSGIRPLSTSESLIGSTFTDRLQQYNQICLCRRSIDEVVQILH